MHQRHGKITRNWFDLSYTYLHLLKKFLTHTVPVRCDKLMEFSVKSEFRFEDSKMLVKKKLAQVKNTPLRMGPEGGGVKKHNSGKQLKQSGYPHADCPGIIGLPFKVVGYIADQLPVIVKIIAVFDAPPK